MDEFHWKRVKCPECGSVRMALYEMTILDANPLQIKCARCGELLMEMGL